MPTYSAYPTDVTLERLASAIVGYLYFATGNPWCEYTITAGSGSITYDGMGRLIDETNKLVIAWYRFKVSSTVDTTFRVTGMMWKYDTTNFKVISCDFTFTQIGGLERYLYFYIYLPYDE